jgi:hypothetical protein
MKSSSTAVAAQMLKLRTAGMGVRAPSPNASTSQLAANVMEGPAEPSARPARVTSGRVGSCKAATACGYQIPSGDNRTHLVLV